MKRKILYTAIALASAICLGIGVSPGKARATSTYYAISTWNYNMCLTPGNAAPRGAVVFIYTCAYDYESWYQWQAVPINFFGVNYSLIVNSQSGLCLFNPDNGHQMTMQNCDTLGNTPGEYWHDIGQGDNCGLPVVVYVDASPANYAVMANASNKNVNRNPVIGWNYGNCNQSYDFWFYYHPAS